MNRYKRGLSLILAVLMVFGLFPAIGVSADTFGSVIYHTNYPEALGLANTTKIDTIEDAESTTIDINLWNGSDFAAAGYTLEKWNTTANGSGVDYALGGNFGPYGGGAPVELFAKWVENEEEPYRSLYEITDDMTEAEKTEIIRAVIAQISITDKVNMLGGTSGNIAAGTSIKNRGAAGGTYTNETLKKYGIVPITLSDGPAGVRMGYKATTWTSPTAIASSWDTEVMEQIADQTGKEAEFYGIDILLSPGQNILRSPLSGRNFEYYSEDSLLSGVNAKLYTEGVQSNNVGVTLKHYAGNEQETNRSGGNVIASERALQEVYMKGFGIAVEAKPWSVMAAYNRVNGEMNVTSRWIMTDMLRDEFGFDGFVMSDWGGTGSIDIRDSILAQMDLAESSMSAANKTRLGDTLTAIEAAKESGDWSAIDEKYRKLDEAVDQSIENILQIMIKTNTFKGSYGEVGVPYDLVEKEKEFYASELFEESNAIARRTAADSMVLLKNEGNILPLAEGTKLGYVNSYNLKGRGGFGDNSVTASDIVARGGGSAGVYFDPTHESVVSLEDALKEKYSLAVDSKNIYEAAGMTTTEIYTYTSGRVTGINLTHTGDFSVETLELTAKAMADSDAAYGVMVISRQTGEGSDNVYGTAEGASSGFLLTANEKSALIAYSNALHAKDKKLVVILNIGAAIDTTEVDEYADAILVSWLAGQEGGHAIVDVLSGAVNPSGKLSQTFTKTIQDSPSFAASLALNAQGIVRTAGSYANGTSSNSDDDLFTNGGWGTNPVFYDEGVLVGYKWFDTKCVSEEEYNSKVSYPFGYGLSYTSFEFSDLKLNKEFFDMENPDDTVTATVTVKNTGTRTGKEVVQLYIGMEDYASEGRPMKDLRGYEKIELEPGESTEVEFIITLSDLQYFDDGFSGVLEGTNLESNIIYGEGEGWTVTNDSVFNVIIGNTSNNYVLEEEGVSTQFIYTDDYVDKSGLQGLYDEYKDIEKGEYTDASWSAFQNALESAGSVLADEEVTQEQVDTALNALRQAHAALVENVSETVNLESSANKGGTVTSEDKVEKGGNAEFTVKADEGYKLVAILVGGVTVDLADMDGDIYKIENVNEDVVLRALFVEDKDTDFAAKFTDVPKTTNSKPTWYYNAVDMLTGLNIVEGMTASTYGPERSVKRSEFTKLLFELAKAMGVEVETETEIPFADMPSASYWATGYIGWAYANGIVNGYNATSFGPEDSISRQDMATMLLRFFEEYMGYELPGDTTKDFTDKGQINKYAQNAVDYVVRTGLMQGFENSTFGPKENTQRSQVAQVFCNYLIFAE